MRWWASDVALILPHADRGRAKTMTTKTERETLQDRFLKMKATEGLVDIKFHLGQVSETTTEAVCAQVNTLLDAVRDGKVRMLDKWNDTRQAA